MVPEACMKINPIPTKAPDGSVNGWLLPIWNATQADYKPAQVYLTVVNVAAMKGPHLHMVRAGRFVCIKGNVRIVTRQWDTYATHETGDVAGFNVVNVPPGMAAAIYNVGDCDAYVLNMPNPAWTKEAPDDHPVVGWDYKL